MNRSQVVFVSLKKPVNFKAMDDDTVNVPVSLLFMIAMKNKHEQNDVLGALMDMFQKQDVLRQLWDCKTIEDFNAVAAANGLE